MKIEIKLHDEACMPLISPNGDWIDLRSAEDIIIEAPRVNVNTNQIELHTGLISLGVSMRLPEGFEAILAPRSSTFKNYGIVFSNSIGILDNSYNGTSDIWRVPFIGLKPGVIKKGDRIAQFRVQKSQFMKRKIEFKVVDKLSEEDRGGFGTSGKQ